MKKHIESIKKAEKEINNAFLKFIIGFTFLADGKDDITCFCKKQCSEIYQHLTKQYLKIKEYYLAFKKRHEEYTKKNN